MIERGDPEMSAHEMLAGDRLIDRELAARNPDKLWVQPDEEPFADVEAQKVPEAVTNETASTKFMGLIRNRGLDLAVAFAILAGASGLGYGVYRGYEKGQQEQAAAMKSLDNGISEKAKKELAEHMGAEHVSSEQIGVVLKDKELLAAYEKMKNEDPKGFEEVLDALRNVREVKN